MYRKKRTWSLKSILYTTGSSLLIISFRIFPYMLMSKTDIRTFPLVSVLLHFVIKSYIFQSVLIRLGYYNKIPQIRCLYSTHLFITVLEPEFSIKVPTDSMSGVAPPSSLHTPPSCYIVTWLRKSSFSHFFLWKHLRTSFWNYFPTFRESAGIKSQFLFLWKYLIGPYSKHIILLGSEV